MSNPVGYPPRVLSTQDQKGMEQKQPDEGKGSGTLARTTSRTATYNPVRLPQPDGGPPRPLVVATSSENRYPTYLTLPGGRGATGHPSSARPLTGRTTPLPTTGRGETPAHAVIHTTPSTTAGRGTQHTPPSATIRVGQGHDQTPGPNTIRIGQGHSSS